MLPIEVYEWQKKVAVVLNLFRHLTYLPRAKYWELNRHLAAAKHLHMFPIPNLQQGLHNDQLNQTTVKKL